MVWSTTSLNQNDSLDLRVHLRTSRVEAIASRLESNQVHWGTLPFPASPGGVRPACVCLSHRDRSSGCGPCKNKTGATGCATGFLGEPNQTWGSGFDGISEQVESWWFDDDCTSTFTSRCFPLAKIACLAWSLKTTLEICALHQ